MLLFCCLNSASAFMKYLESFFLSLLVLCGLLVTHKQNVEVCSASVRGNYIAASHGINIADNTRDKNSGWELYLTRIKCTNEDGKLKYCSPSYKIAVRTHAEQVLSLLGEGSSEPAFCSGGNHLHFEEFLYSTPLRSPPHCC